MNSLEKHEIYLMEIEDNLIYNINQLELGHLVSCENCGNIWDGHAQCNCWQWDEIFSDNNEVNINDAINDYYTEYGYNIEDSHTDGESFTDSDDYDSDFDPVIYGGDPLLY